LIILTSPSLSHSACILETELLNDVVWEPYRLLQVASGTIPADADEAERANMWREFTPALMAVGASYAIELHRRGDDLAIALFGTYYDLFDYQRGSDRHMTLSAIYAEGEDRPPVMVTYNGPMPDYDYEADRAMLMARNAEFYGVLLENMRSN
jgi:hypothetical protein